MSREDWDIFYPLSNWSDIKNWSAQRNSIRTRLPG